MKIKRILSILILFASTLGVKTIAAARPSPSDGGLVRTLTGVVWPESCIHGCKPSQAYIDSGEQVKVQVTSGGATDGVDAVVSPYFYKTYVPIVARFSAR